MTDIFISYSRRDIAFARLLYQALKDSQLEIWIDWERIPVGELWWNEITGAIENANVFMFIISHHSLGSDVCKNEISHALANHKRIIPVIVDDLKAADIAEFMPELGRINWMIFQREQVFHLEESSEDERTVAFPKQPQFEQAMVKLSQTVRIDWDWLRQHTRLQVRALEWERYKSDVSYLLRGTDLEEAEAWLAKAGSKEQQPTTLQAQYLSTSRAEETLRQKESIRRQRITLGAILVGLVVAIILGLVAWGQRNQYLDETHVRATAESNAVSESHTRATAEANAVAKEQARATAESNAVSKEQARATAQALAENQARLALAGKLAANALTVQSGQFDLSMLLAVRAYDTAANVQSLQGLVNALDYSPRLAHILPAQTQSGVMPLSYGGKITMALSPDGKILAILTCTALDNNRMSCVSNEVRLWDTITWQRIGSPIRNAAAEELIDGITFSQQGNELVLVTVARYPLRVSTWRVSDQTRLSFFIPKKSEVDQPISESVFSLAFSSDGRRIVVSICSSYDSNPIEGCKKAEIRLVDWASQKELAHWDVTAIVENMRITTVPAVMVFSPDGTRLAYGIYPGKINILDIVTGEPVGKSLSFGSGTATPSDLTFSPDGKTLAASGCGLTGSATTYSYCLEGVIYFYDLEKGIVSGSALRGHSDDTILLKYSPDGKKLVSGSHDRTLWLWDPLKRQPLSAALRGHDASLSSLAVSADGAHAYSSDTSGQVIAWDIGETTNLVSALEGGVDTRSEARLAVSPDGKRVAASTGWNEIVMWDAQTGKQVIPPLKTQDSYLKAMAFSDDGKNLLTSGRARPLERWDLTSGSTTPTSLLVNLYETNIARAMAGGRLVNVYNDVKNTRTLVDVTSGLPIGEPATDSGYGTVFASTPDASLLAMGSCAQPGKDGKECTQSEIRLVHLPDWTPVGAPLRGHTAAVRVLALSADGKTLVSSAGGGSLLVWAVGSPAAPRSIDTAPAGLEAGFFFSPLILSADGRWLAVSAIFPSKPAFFDTTNGAYLGKVGEMFGGSTSANGVFSPDGRLFAAGGGSGEFYLVTGVSTGQPVPRIIKDKDSAFMAFSPDGKTFASAGAGVSLWTVEGEILTKGKTLSGFGRNICGLAFTPDGATLGVLYDDYTVELWNPATGMILARPYFGALYNLAAPAFNRDATLIAAGVCVKYQYSSVCLQSEIHFWDTTTGQEAGPPILLAANTKISALAFSRDGRWLASANCVDDRTIVNALKLCTQSEVRLWDTAARKSLGPPLTGLIYDAANLAFSPDGSLLAGSDTKQVVLWETASGKQHAAPTPLAGGRGLAFYSDGSLLVVGMGNGITLIDPESGRIVGQSTQAGADQVAFNPKSATLFSRAAAWQLDPSVWRARLCSQAGRDLTQTEWAVYLPGLAYQKTCVP